MIITQDPTAVSRTGNLPERAFTIKPTKKLIKLLTSGLYSNPVRAVMVENSQNAWDSHVKAGIADKPFKVHLPTTFHPHYSIRDYGVGMSHDFMMKGYTKVGESTKDMDATMAGGWGIGRLASFAISDAYTVICFDGKMRREYSIFMNEEGFPSVALLVENEDVSERGVEVKFPVAPSLHSQFQSEIQHVYKFYAVKPVVKGGSHFEGFEDIQYTMKADDGSWAFFKDSYQVSTAIMGVYHFPINVDAIVKLNDEHRALIESGIVLNMPMNSMETTSSREALNYTDQTNVALKKVLDKAQADMALYIQKEFDKATSILEAKRLYFSYFRPGGLANKIGRILGEKPVVMFNGEKITDCTLELTDGTTAHSFIEHWKRGKQVVGKNDYVTDIMLQPSVFIFEADGRYGSRVKHYVRENLDGHGQLAIVLVFKDAVAKDLFYKTNGLDKASVFTLTSTLPTPPRVTGEREKKVIIFSLDEKAALAEKHYRASDACEYWDAEMVENENAKDDEDDEVPAKFADIEEKNPVYLVIDRYQPQGFNRAFQRIAIVLKKIRAANPNLGTIYGIRPSAVADAKKAGWVTFAEMAKPLVEAYLKDNQSYEKVSLCGDFDRFVSHGLESLIPGLKKAKERAKEIESINDENSEMERTAHVIGAKVPARIKEDVTKDIKVIIKDLYIKYPLLNKMLSSYQFDKNDIKEYIALVDKVG